MASDPILAVEANIDDQIIQFCKTRPGLTEEQVVRDIARIVCIVNLVRNGTLDGENTVLCGGMAMRCLDSPRMSVFDGDTSSRSEPDPEVLRDAISYEAQGCRFDSCTAHFHESPAKQLASAWLERGARRRCRPR